MKYIFLDIDGTLYSTKTNSIPDSALNAINKAKENGHKVFLSTGRTLGSVKLYLNLNVDGFILGSGTKVYVEGKTIYNNPIDKIDLAFLRDLLKHYKAGCLLEGNAGAYFDDIASEYVYSYFKHNKTLEESISIAQKSGFYPMNYFSDFEEIYKMCIYHKNETDFNKMMWDVPSKYKCLVTSYKKDEYVCELIFKKYNKATAIKHVLDYYGSDYDSAIAIGDSINDLEMLEMCKVGVAMGNASDDAKEVADFITDDILDDGIYNAFKKLGVI